MARMDTDVGGYGIPAIPTLPTQGVQQSLLHQTTATPPTEFTERTEPSGRERAPTDGTDEHRLLWCAVLSRNSRNSQNLAAWVWQGCHTLLICEHLCSSVGGSSLPEGSVCSVRSAGISFLPRMAQIDTYGWGALFSHRIHRIHRIGQRGYGRDAIPSYICEHPCSSVGGSSLPEGSVCAFCGRAPQLGWCT